MKAPKTLTDRFALAFFSGATACVLGLIAWFAIAQYVSDDGRTLLPLRFVWYFALGMALLGFLLAENVIVWVVVALLEAVLGWRTRRPP